ncbi:SDR family NAD(P)-dependent oxidoreductase, partial [Frankia sp. Cpl3]|nr:SDR family NAD(P)-dependent oxidoreductase [Frankia sp. Cpl3]
AVVVGSLRRGEGDVGRVARSAAELFVRGVPVSWDAVLPAWRAEPETVAVPAASRPVSAPVPDLPTYPFQHQRYWLAGRGGQAGRGDVTAAGLEPTGHPLLGAVLEIPGRAAAGESGADEVAFSARVSARTHPWLADHSVHGTRLLPATAWIEIALHAGERVGYPALDELLIEAPLTIPDEGAVLLRVLVGGPDATGRRPVRLYARPDTTTSPAEPEDVRWARHATGALSQDVGEPTHGYETWPPADAVPVDLADFYPRLAGLGYEYGPAFAGVRAAWTRGREVFAEVELPVAQDDPGNGTDGAYGLHPALLDAALQTTNLGAVPAARDGQVLLPFAWSDIRRFATGATSLRVHAEQVDPTDPTDGGGSYGVRVRVSDRGGAPVAEIGSLVLRPTSAEQIARLAGATGGTVAGALFHVTWVDPPSAGDERSPAAADGVDVLDVTGRDDASPAAVRVLLTDVLAGLRQALDAPTPTATATPTATPTPDAGPGGPAGPLVLLTDDPVGAPAAAAVWGLVRAAQAEHPGRFVLLGGEPAESRAQLRAVLAGGEPQAVVRGGRILVPRLGAAPRPPRDDVWVPPDEAGPALGAGTTLVTGGTGTIGAVVARELVHTHGARHLVLLSRRGSDAPGAVDLADELRAAGAEVTLVAADAADREELRAVLAAIPAAAPLVGVVHIAGVVADGLVTSLDQERIDAVLRPKADAAWHLHELTAPTELAAFVLFSSGSGAFGGAGQGNYVAANGYLDALAEQRRLRGLPAVSVAWGLWERSSGLTGRLTGTDRGRMARGGVRGLSDAEGAALFGAALRSSEAVLVAAAVDIAALRRRSAAGDLPPLLRGLVPDTRPVGGSASTGAPAAPTREFTPASSGANSGGNALLRRLAGRPEQERRRVLVDVVRAHVSTVLGHRPGDAVDPGATFQELGFDSLTGVELRNRLAEAAGVRLAATMVFDHPTPADLAAHLLRLVDQDGSPSVPAPSGGSGTVTGASVLEELARLEQVLAGATTASVPVPDEVAVRLRALVSSLSPRGETAATVDLATATDDEMFQLLDQGLGS